MNSARAENGMLCRIVSENDIVVFNVEYRLAPEHRTPAGTLDYISTLKHAHEKADEYGIDKDKICIGGISAGGYMSMIACILLVRQNLSHLVNTQILMAPMLGTSLDDLPDNSIDLWEKPYLNCINFELIASDYKKQHLEADPLLYPVEVSIEEANFFPKTVVFTSEYDWMRRDSYSLITKL